MRPPIESVARPVLEARYRRMRLATVILAATSVLLMVAVGTQAFSAPIEGDEAAATSEVGAEAQQASEQCPVEDRRDPNDPRAIGNVDAPIVVHEWTDFRCPYCGSFSRDTLPVLLEEYVDTGKVRLEIHDAALVGGENSILIAAASRAAGEQGRYFEYYDEIYLEMEAQGESRVEYSMDTLVQLAERAGVPDIAAFTAAVESGEFESAVREDTARAQQIGVTGVPFFATSGCGQVLSGAQPVETFRAALDAAIETANAK